MMMDVLASHGGCRRLRMDGGRLSTSILELPTLLLEPTADGRVVAVVDAAFLDRSNVVLVLLREHLSILDRLNGRVEVILVNLAV